MTVKVSAIAITAPTVGGMRRVQTQMEAATQQAIRQAGLVLERATKETLSQNGRHRPGTPTPSVAPNPPSIITGALRASVRTDQPKRVGFAAYELSVGPTLVYGRVQELGGGRSNLPARPYLRPSFERSQARMSSVYVSAWRAAMMRGMGI